MQREPNEFGAASASRTKRHALGISRPAQRKTPPSTDLATEEVLDKAFADYTRIDAGSSPSAHADSNRGASKNWRLVTRELIADIETQLETLDRQRRQLARLLEGVALDAIA